MTTTRPSVGFVGPELAIEVVRGALGAEIDLLPIEVDQVALRRVLPALDGLVEATTRLRLDASSFDSAPQLKIVSVAGTGDAHIDREAARARNIEVRTLTEDRALLERLDPTAEHTWGLLLSCARRIADASDHVLAGGWEREVFPGVLLSGRQLGIVGLGRLGRKVARFGLAFGMEVVAHDLLGHPPPPDGVTMVNLETLCSTSDVVTIHLPLDSSTAGLIDSRLIGLMHPQSILVNTSRGAIIDGQALIAALEEKAIAGAALDVLATEPPSVDDPVVAYARLDPRLLITPHLGGFVPEVLMEVCAHAAGKVRTHLVGPQL